MVLASLFYEFNYKCHICKIVNHADLTYLSLDKMAASLAEDIFKRIFLDENDRIPIHISLKFVPRSPIGNKSTLVRVMAWHQTGDKPLSEPMMIQYTDVYASLGGDELTHASFSAHHAKYGTYSLMDMAKQKIHDVILVQVS